LVIALVVARIGAEIKKVPKVRSEQDAKGKFTGITPTPTCAISSFKLLPPAGGRRPRLWRRGARLKKHTPQTWKNAISHRV
jgi:hypothetical protein